MTSSATCSNRLVNIILVPFPPIGNIILTHPMLRHPISSRIMRNLLPIRHLRNISAISSLGCTWCLTPVTCPKMLINSFLRLYVCEIIHHARISKREKIEESLDIIVAKDVLPRPGMPTIEIVSDSSVSLVSRWISFSVSSSNPTALQLFEYSV